MLSHESLAEIAGAASTRRPVEPLLPRNMSERRRAGVANAVAEGLSVPPEKLPRLPERVSRRPTEAERKRFVDLQKRRDARAAELGIDPTLIASRGALSSLARNWDKHESELMKWQRELLKGA